MKIAITGEKGFLGYHLTQYYKYISKDEYPEWGFANHVVVELGKNYLENINLLKDCDLLIHCAGVNRGDDIYQKNISLAQELVDSLKKNKIVIDIKFTSSTQEDNKSEYGNSKLKAKQILNKYCTLVNTKFTSYKLPNLFGPFGKPNYNSFINTFCYNLVNNIPCQYNGNKVTLCYVYDAIKVIDGIKSNYNTHDISVENVYKILNNFYTEYSKSVIPKLNTEFEKNLFNTLRSFMPLGFNLTRHTDDRGFLVELVKNKGSESQVFFSTTNPGITRGDHFHFGKVERFCILSGEAKISLRKIGSNKKLHYIIKSNDNKVIDMPILYTHNITNIGKDSLICVFWVNEIFNPKDTDTYFEKV
jgi:UDP-2-acetamido-2,6-beta-L-arabino-hexul-4-ose reductase